MLWVKSNDNEHSIQWQVHVLWPNVCNLRWPGIKQSSTDSKAEPKHGPTYLCSTGTWPIHCCLPAQGTLIWRPAFLPGHRGYSEDNSLAEDSGGWPGHLHHGEGLPSLSVHEGSFERERKEKKRLQHDIWKNPIKGIRGWWRYGNLQMLPGLPPDHIQFVQELVDARVVVITLGHH